jgi:hypothetical protein
MGYIGTILFPGHHTGSWDTYLAYNSIKSNISINGKITEQESSLKCVGWYIAIYSTNMDLEEYISEIYQMTFWDKGEED